MRSKRRGPLDATRLDDLWVPAEQRPRSLWVPEYATSSGNEAMEVARLAGIDLDPWQEFVFRESLGERADGTWAAMQVGLEVPRQNGKGGVMEARQLAGMFLFEEELQVHSAHEFSTSLAAFDRLKRLVEETPDFDREVLSIKDSHGAEGIYLRGDRQLRYRTRTKSGGRGLTGRETLYLDEAMILKEAMMGALMPILSARPNPQIWLVGSAVDQEEHEHGVVFARLRERGLAGGESRIAWFGWGWCPTTDEEREKPLLPGEAGEVLDDREFWERSNPALGIRITEDFVDEERRTLDARNFAVERLGIGDWPDTTKVGADELFDRDEWADILERKSGIDGSPVLAWDVSPDRAWASIGASGPRPTDDNLHIELVDRRRGTGWVAERLGELVSKHGVTEGSVLVDGRSQAASLIPAVEEEIGFEVTVVSTAEYAEACANFFDAVPQKTMRHNGGREELDTAVHGAATRPLGEAWGWGRKKATTDITPLVACTIARWGAARGEEESVYQERGVIVLGGAEG